MGQIAKYAVDSLSGYITVKPCLKSDDLEQSILENDPDIVVEFTDANSVFKNSECIIQMNKHPIIGSSGLSNEHIKYLQSISKKGGLIVPNFSLGAILMMHFSSIAAKVIKKHI